MMTMGRTTGQGENDDEPEYISIHTLHTILL
jgi:hypothetical protein